MMDEEKKYRGTYNPDKSRGEILKDRVSTREYFYDEEGKPFSGLKKAEQRAAELNNADPSSRTKMLEKEMEDGVLKKGLVGLSRLADTVGFRQEDKYGGKTKEDMAVKKAKGGMISSASKRADGCCVKGKTRGKIV